MKEYLKMADVFAGECITPESADYEIYIRMPLSGGEIFCGEFSSRRLAKYAAHAINSHDELVAEVERLRHHLAKVKLLCGYFANCGGWDINAYSEYVNANIYPIWSPQEEVE